MEVRLFEEELVEVFTCWLPLLLLRCGATVLLLDPVAVAGGCLNTETEVREKNIGFVFFRQ